MLALLPQVREMPKGGGTLSATRAVFLLEGMYAAHAGDRQREERLRAALCALDALADAREAILDDLSYHNAEIVRDVLTALDAAEGRALDVLDEEPRDPVEVCA